MPTLHKATSASTTGWWWTLEQWAWYIDDTYTYTVYGVDNSWESIRLTLDLLNTTSTWVSTWTKPTSLLEVQALAYT